MIMTSLRGQSHCLTKQKARLGLGRSNTGGQRVPGMWAVLERVRAASGGGPPSAGTAPRWPSNFTR
jgi:hypothetical protein